MDDIGMGIAEAALNGFRLGKRIQQEEALQSWQDYAAELERRLDQVHQTLVETRADLSKYRSLCSVIQERLDIAQKNNVEFERFIKEKNNQFDAVMAAHQGSILAFEQSITKKDQKIESWKSYAEKLNKNNIVLKGILKLVSTRSAALDGIYQMLLAEASRFCGAEKFESMSTEKIEQEVEKSRVEFEQSGRLTYAPKVEIIRKKICD